ncbi:MAG TPA: hypothetical protein VJY41_06790 [Prolixibacteraceae bacterium]|nr:hypothetical protein [Prolixibacteraceae bacterium]
MIKFVNLLLFVLMIVMNYLANALPINGKTTGQLSGLYPNLFVPAGITFSIWGVIYLLLAVFCVVQFFPSSNLIVEKIGWLFALSSLLNGLWILAWHYQKLSLSLVVMLGMLVLLTLINLKLKHEPFGITKAAFGVYLGWICIATIANVTALLVSVNWLGFGISPQTWTVVMIAVGLIITSLTVFRMNNPFVGLAVVWAFAGIAIKRQSDYQLIFIVVIIAAILAAAVVVVGFFKKTILN